MTDRAEDPYYLTSMTFAMGSLLTEGDHLYLDRNADWRGALDLLMGDAGFRRPAPNPWLWPEQSASDEASQADESDEAR